MAAPTKLTPADILFEDHHLIVLNKPAPLLTQAPVGIPSLEAMVKDYIKEKYSKPAGVYLGIPHRLDRPVSGVVVFARNTKAAQRVHAQFHERQTIKIYWALVEGRVESQSGVWEDCLLKLSEESRVIRAEANQPGGKQATTDYKVLEEKDVVSLLELSPRTGRMHQLRVQCAWRGLPVLGDELYGSTRGFGPTAELPRDRRIALHARRLTLTHPFTKEAVTFTAPLSKEWRDYGLAGFNTSSRDN